MYVSDKKKSLERKALDAFLQSNRKLKGFTIADGERPDFVLTNYSTHLEEVNYPAGTWYSTTLFIKYL